MEGFSSAMPVEVTAVRVRDRLTHVRVAVELADAGGGDSAVKVPRTRSRASGDELVVADKGARLFYAGSAETPIRLKLLGTGEVRSGASGFAQLELRDPLPLTRGDRFVLRDAGRILTFGGGVVADPLPDRARRGIERETYGRSSHGVVPFIVQDARLKPKRQVARDRAVGLETNHRPIGGAGTPVPAVPGGAHVPYMPVRVRPFVTHPP